MTRPNAPLSGPSRDDQQKPPEPTPTPTSHREKRKARKRRNSVAELTSPLTRIASQTDELALTRRRSRKSSTSATVPVPVSISRIETPSITRPMSRANLPLLVASIGNPAPAYTNTLHSAGHTILNRIRLIRPFTPFTKDKNLGGGLVSVPITASTFSFIPFVGGGKKQWELHPDEDHWTLWQSPSLMNVSGKSVGTAWRAWEKSWGKGGVLVVIHDELEKELGKVSFRRGGSARGHNGLKSVQAALPNTPWVRIGIGIGRPISREPDAVARYVLKKMSPNELATIEDSVGEVIELLRDVAEGKR